MVGLQVVGCTAQQKMGISREHHLTNKQEMESFSKSTAQQFLHRCKESFLTYCRRCHA